MLVSVLGGTTGKFHYGQLKVGSRYTQWLRKDVVAKNEQQRGNPRKNSGSWNDRKREIERAFKINDDTKIVLLLLRDIQSNIADSMENLVKQITTRLANMDGCLQALENQHRGH